MDNFPTFSRSRDRTGMGMGSLEPLLQARSDGIKKKRSLLFLSRLISDSAPILPKIFHYSGKARNPRRSFHSRDIQSTHYRWKRSARRSNEGNWLCGAWDPPSRSEIPRSQLGKETSHTKKWSYDPNSFWHILQTSNTTNPSLEWQAELLSLWSSKIGHLTASCFLHLKLTRSSRA